MNRSSLPLKKVGIRSCFERLAGGVVLLLALGSCAHPPCRCTCEIKVPAAAHVHDVEPKRGERVAEGVAPGIDWGTIVLEGDGIPDVVIRPGACSGTTCTLACCPCDVSGWMVTE